MPKTLAARSVLWEDQPYKSSCSGGTKLGLSQLRCLFRTHLGSPKGSPCRHTPGGTGVTEHHPSSGELFAGGHRRGKGSTGPWESCSPKAEFEKYWENTATVKFSSLCAMSVRETATLHIPGRFPLFSLNYQKNFTTRLRRRFFFPSRP